MADISQWWRHRGAKKDLVGEFCRAFPRGFEITAIGDMDARTREVRDRAFTEFYELEERGRRPTSSVPPPKPPPPDPVLDPDDLVALLDSVRRLGWIVSKVVERTGANEAFHQPNERPGDDLQTVLRALDLLRKRIAERVGV